MVQQSQRERRYPSLRSQPSGAILKGLFEAPEEEDDETEDTEEEEAKEEDLRQTRRRRREGPTPRSADEDQALRGVVEATAAAIATPADVDAAKEKNDEDKDEDDDDDEDYPRLDPFSVFAAMGIKMSAKGSGKNDASVGGGGTEGRGRGAPESTPSARDLPTGNVDRRTNTITPPGGPGGADTGRSVLSYILG